MTYAPQGALGHITVGSGSGALSEDWSYNNRRQPTSIALGSLLTMSFEYSSTPNDNTHNNGNVLTQTLAMKKTDGTNVSLKQYYQYDGANRLTQVAEYQTSGTPVCPDGTSQWCENFGYDNFGNRLIPARSGFSAPLNEPQGYNTANNRITGTGWQYDNGVSNYRGNITADPAPNSYTYDAESRLTHYSGIGATTDYSYDGDGQRVKKVSGATTTVFVYDAEGELAAEYTTPAPGLGGRRFFSVDHLGSTRLITDAGGGVLERHDYRPFGDEVTFTAGQVRAGVAGYGVDQGTREKFTGKERDQESGLDFFGARYLSSAQGRFTSPDSSAKPDPLPYSDLTDPQTFNLYAYVRNSPLTRTDVDGHCGGGSGDPPCEAIKMDVKIEQQPTIQKNVKLPDGSKATGVEGLLTYTVTVGGKPLSDVKVSEHNDVKNSVNGKPIEAELIEAKTTTNTKGQLGDKIALLQTTSGSKKDNKEIVQDFKTNAYSSVDKQTMTLTLPGGEQCSATSTRTLTNAGADGKAVSKYTLDPTEPVVTNK